MKQSEIKVNADNLKYSVFIGSNILNLLSNKIKILCPSAEKIALVIDNKVPVNFINQIKNNLKNYKIYQYKYKSSEKIKSFKYANNLIEKMLSKNFNRADVLIGVGGGIVGDFSAFAASIMKRGMNFINIPTTLLSQVDSSIGGKTAVNSSYGKNLIGTFYQPKLVISDVLFLKSLPNREMVCGYAEILKHSIIQKNSFFKWLKINSQNILKKKDMNALKIAIYESCKIKKIFITKDLHESGERMVLNFGHTFAHAIEAINKFSRKINHGEAVLIGMMMAAKISHIKGICKNQTLSELIYVYEKNKLNFNLRKIFKKKEYNKMAKFMINDKKNNDKKINLILLKKIGQTTKPGNIKYSYQHIKKLIEKII